MMGSKFNMSICISLRSTTSFAIIAACAALTGPMIAQAQDYSHVAPNLPPPIARPAVATPPPATATPTPAAVSVILPMLKGIVFKTGIDRLVEEGLPFDPAGPTNIDVADVPELTAPAFQNEVRAFINKLFSTADLAQLTTLTRAWLVAHGEPFVDVTIPAQNVTTGVIQVIVTKYRLGAVSVTGNRHFSTNSILRSADLRHGQALSTRVVEADIARVNDNPFLGVNAVFSPGAAPGTTDIELRATDRLPLRVYAGFDDQGYRSLGLDEFDLGFNWGNAFGTGQILSYQYTRSFSGRFASHSGSDVVPLSWGDKLLVFGSYATVKPAIAAGFDNVGHSGQASIRYVHALPDWGWLKGHLQAGYDYKTTNNNLVFQGMQVLASAADVHQFLGVFDGVETDRLGQTAIENDLVYAPGKLTGRNTNAAFDQLTPGARAKYLYDRLSITRTTLLPGHFTSVSRASVQESTEILPNSEQIGGGGIGSARGYYPDTGVGSDGILLSQELRAPAFSLWKLFAHNSKFGDQLQPGVFIDYAHLRQTKAVVGVSPPLDLASAGFLLHYSAVRHVDINFDLGFRLKRAPTEPNKGSYASIAIVIAH